MKGRRGGLAAMARDWAPWTGLAGLFLSFAGLSALWAFLTELAPTFGVSNQVAGEAFVAALVVSGVAGIAAAVLGDRLGRAKPLAVGMLLAIAGAAALQWGHGFSGYLVGVVLAVGVWNFPMAYQMGMIASADERGHVAVLMPAALAIGGALGPMVAGALLTGAQGYASLCGTLRRCDVARARGVRHPWLLADRRGRSAAGFRPRSDRRAWAAWSCRRSVE